MCVCVCAEVGGWWWGDNKAKHYSEGDRWQRGSLVEDRQTLLDTSLALSSVFLEFTDKKHAGGRHHQCVRVCVCVCWQRTVCAFVLCGKEGGESGKGEKEGQPGRSH